MAENKGKGLEGVVAARTSISDIDGQQGKLFYCGYDIADLAEHASFEETVYLLHHADHTMNASTFAGRVAAATLADIYAAVTAAIATLQGPLHGGAIEQVRYMLDEIGTPDRAADYVRNRLAGKQKVMGFGHRVYKTWDPRATILREMSRRIGGQLGDTHWFEISERIQETVRAEKGLYPNVDFYTASVYSALGIPPDLYTTLFATARMAGWTAHIREQYADNRLIRPDSEYIGPGPRRYQDIDQRDGEREKG